MSRLRGNLTTQNTPPVFNQSCVFFLHCNLADRKGQYWKWVPFIPSLFWVFSSIRDQNFCQLSSTENKSFVTFSVNKVSPHQLNMEAGLVTACSHRSLPACCVDVSRPMLNPVLPREVMICWHATINVRKHHKLSYSQNNCVFCYLSKMFDVLLWPFKIHCKSLIFSHVYFIKNFSD